MESASAEDSDSESGGPASNEDFETEDDGESEDDGERSRCCFC